MAKRRRDRRSKSAEAFLLPLMLTETFLSSVQTIGWRFLLLAEGRCSPAEYRRMIVEKAAAVHDSASVLTRSRGPGDAVALLSPWHRRVKANARRLSKS